MKFTRDEILATGCGTQIADDAVRHGYMPILIQDNGKLGDGRIALYHCGDGHAQAITTNGTTVWEEATDTETWSDAMKQLEA